MSSAVSPRSASVADDTSMKMRSSCVPKRSTLATPGMRRRISRARLREVLQLRVGEALTGNGVERDVGVAELVVEEGTDHALGQRLTNITDLLASLVERILDGISAHSSPSN